MLKRAKRQAKGSEPNAARNLSRRGKFKVVDLRRAIKDLRQLNPEIRYTGCFEAEPFTSGLIAFRPRNNSDPKQIKHDDKDVLCYVVKGRGRLRLKRRRIELRPGMICHIPKGNPHDFAAGKRGELVLFYSLIRTT
jgi:mannose-6-phosphate isomerase-like protein (cupin superfamily)